MTQTISRYKTMRRPESDMTSITHDNTPWFTVDSVGTEYLAARADRSDIRRPMLHRFSTSTPVQYRQLSGHLLAFGFDIIDNPGQSNANDVIPLTVRKQSITTPDSVASTRRTLDAAVEKFGGGYESWSTYVVVASRREMRREKLESVRGRIPAPQRRSRIDE